MLDPNFKTEFKTNVRRLLIGWLICSCLIFAMFVGYWIWSGMPRGPHGLLMTFIEQAIISIIVPPVVWLIGKAFIG